MVPDSELVSAYATERSEAAFRALVTRHVDLVFATALRQVGDSGIAEEVTQNVFITLARKSPRLGGVETLAGWLHRTAIFESKSRIRSELRRRRREETAATISELERDGDPTLAPLIPLLDEALLNLREADRLALVLRYLEERSMREVGNALGLDEDAARKRVSRALEKLCEFFRKRGFAVSIAIGASTLTTTAKAAPAGLANAAAKAGLAAGGATSAWHLLLFYLSALTKTQTVVICVLAALAPIVWQERASAQINEQQRTLELQLSAARQKADKLDRDTQRIQETVLKTKTDTQSAQALLTTLSVQRTGKASPPEYQWDDNSPVMRIPKAFLSSLGVSGVQNQRGELTVPIKEILQFTDEEQRRVQDALKNFLAAYQTELIPHFRQVVPTKADSWGDREVRAFELEGKALIPKIEELRKGLFEELAATMGQERFKLFRESLTDWMPIDGRYHGLGSSRAVFDFDCRVVFAKPHPGSSFIGYKLQGPGIMSTEISFGDLPDFLRPTFQDWIAVSPNKPSVVQNK